MGEKKINTGMGGDDLMTKQEVATMLQCTVRGVDSLRKSAGLPWLAIGRKVLFSRGLVEKWLKERVRNG